MQYMRPPVEINFNMALRRKCLPTHTSHALKLSVSYGSNNVSYGSVVFALSSYEIIRIFLLDFKFTV